MPLLLAMYKSCLYTDSEKDLMVRADDPLFETHILQQAAQEAIVSRGHPAVTDAQSLLLVAADIHPSAPSPQ
jgi:hypothetical protein